MTRAAASLSVSRRIGATVAVAASVAVVASLSTVVVFFIAGGADSKNFPQLGAFFALSAVFSFILLAVVAVVGFFARWYTALAGAIVAGAVAAFLGALLFQAASGVAFSPQLADYALGTLVGPNLVFLLTVVIAAVTLGRSLWRAIVQSGSASASRGVALVRMPSPQLAEGELTHIERTPVDAELAGAQWDEYIATLSLAGWDVVDVAPAPEHPDSVFIEDAVVVFGDTAVVASPGAESRRGEIVGAEASVRELGLRVERIELPGTLDGGDVLKVGTTVYVGRGGRTNGEGIRQLRALVAPLGYTVVAVPVTKALHLKSAVTALPDGTVIGFPPLVDDSSVFARFLPVPEETGVAVVVLTEDTVLMAASAPKSAALIESLGYRVITVDISEFEKLEGCVTCLSVRVR
jgi:dimethylargininase